MSEEQNKTETETPSDNGSASSAEVCYMADKRPKFRARVNGIEVKDGDYWLPESECQMFGIKANSETCYPVKVCSHGILYCRKKRNISIIEFEGRSFYEDWEHPDLASLDVEICQSI